MPFVWVTNVGVGASIDAADRNETKTNIGALYTALGANWPGNPRFPACGGAGFDMAAPCPVVWNIAVDDPIYQTPGAHPVSELQEARDKLDWIDANKCAADNAVFDSAEDFGEDAGVNVGADTGEDAGADTGADAGDNAGANISEDAGANAGEDNMENFGANVVVEVGDDFSAETGDDSGEDAGDDDGVNASADSGANTGEDNAENVSADSGADTGDDDSVDVGADAGADAGVNVGADSIVNTGDNIGAFAIHDGLHRAADCLADDAGHFSSVESSNWVANDITDLQIVLVADFGCPGFWALVNVNDH